MAKNEKRVIIEDDDDIEVTKKTSKERVPPGYLPIEMSTKGKLRVPSTVHVKNFSTEDLVELSMLATEVIPSSLVSILNNLIWEDTDIADWPEPCVTELIVKMYVNFFSPSLPDTTFPLDKEDRDLIIEKRKKKMVEEGKDEEEVDTKNMPTYTLDLQLTDFNTYEIPTGLKPYVIIKRKNPVFEAKFLTYPRYGDSILLKKWIEDKYRDEDKEYKGIEKLRDSGAEISPEEEISFQMHNISKLRTAITGAKAMTLVEVDGKNVEHLSLDEKMELIQDHPHLRDINLSKKLDRHYEELRLGLNPELNVKNPLTGEDCTRRFYFRLLDILQAIQTLIPDEYDISYDG